MDEYSSPGIPAPRQPEAGVTFTYVTCKIRTLRPMTTEELEAAVVAAWTGATEYNRTVGLA